MGQDHTQEFLHELIGIKKMVEQLEQKNKSDKAMLDFYKNALKPQNMDDNSKHLIEAQDQISQLREQNLILNSKLKLLSEHNNHLQNTINHQTDQLRKWDLENSNLKTQIQALQSKSHQDDNEAGTSIRGEQMSMIPADTDPKTIMGAAAADPETNMRAAKTGNTQVPSYQDPHDQPQSLVQQGKDFVLNKIGFKRTPLSQTPASGNNKTLFHVNLSPNIIAPIPEDQDVLGMSATQLDEYAQSNNIKVSGRTSMEDRLERVLDAMNDEQLKNYKTKYKISESLDRKKSFEELGKITMLSDLLNKATETEWKASFKSKFENVEKNKRDITSALSNMTPQERNALRNLVFSMKIREKKLFCSICETYGITCENKKGTNVEDLYPYAMENTETVTEYV
ncbi:MAG: hypothetical protein EBR09_15770 [Proteobacteria bacterium]|nr:hypothetical protein [Pseudomonadota bacterium]